ncbi:MAG: DUF4325 domain-containing protein [Candidatus Moraniibacteriota bacterium]
MLIQVKKFGDILVSRPSGKEAFLAAKSSLLRDVDVSELIDLDFDGVRVLTPSWADEFITPIKNEFRNVQLLNVTNASVKATLATLAEFSE